jgi:demethylmenaquinone methyltransferase / 2-methoxy-6-polyprenyl-1,4-benzoquinol methylase
MTRLAGHAPIEPHPVLSRFYGEQPQRSSFVRRLFNETAPYYDEMNGIFSLGSGGRYRRRSLVNAGLQQGQRVIDVAVGTGLVAREAVAITGSPHNVIGVDVSEAMLAVARRNLGIPLVQGVAEDLPLGNECADFVSLGFALRHVSDLVGTFREFHRVLRKGGTTLILEIGAPSHPLRRKLLAAYFSRIIPFCYGRTLGKAPAQRLMEYYWETIDNCVPAAVILEAMRNTGFEDAQCHIEFDIFRSYIGHKQ